MYEKELYMDRKSSDMRATRHMEMPLKRTMTAIIAAFNKSIITGTVQCSTVSAVPVLQG